VIKRQYLITVVVIILLGVILASCSSQTGTTTGDSTIPQNTTSVSSGPAQTSVQTGTTPTDKSSRYGGTLKIIAGLAPGTAGGWPSEFASQSDDARPVLETLIRVDNKGNIIPWLAESYKISDDMKSITFNIRKGVKFHDGSDFNADAAKWNLDNYIKANSTPPSAPPAGGSAPADGAPAGGAPPVIEKPAGTLTSVDIIDEFTIKVNFNKWSNLIWSTLYEQGFTTMVSKAAFEKNGKTWMRDNPVGTGPFKFESFQNQVSLKFVRNSDYWGKDDQGNQLPYLDAIEINYVSDHFTQKVMMQTKEGDMTDISIVSGKSAADYKSLGLDVAPIIGASLCLIPDTGNTDSPWANAKVREALEYAIDRDSIANAFGFGFWSPQYQIPGPASSVYNPDFKFVRKYDMAKAKALLSEAGYPAGFKTTLVVMPITGTEKDIYIALQDYFAKVGIQTNLNFTTSFPAYMDAVNSTHSMLNASQLIDNNANFMMPLNFVLSKTSMFNRNWQKTDEYLKLTDASLASPTANVDLMRAVTDYLSQNSLLIPIAGSGRAFAKQPYVMDTGAGDLSLPALWKYEQTWLNK
jgi:peptide/nickel transport system substrate-binding protein